MRRTISRAQCEAQMSVKTSPMSTVTKLDFYRELYQANFACMLSGLPYSKQAMDSALNAIMSIAIEDEMHQRFGELPQPIREAVDEEVASDAEWLGLDTPFTLSDTDLPDEGTDTRASTQWREHGYY